MTVSQSFNENKTVELLKSINKTSFIWIFQEWKRKKKKKKSGNITCLVIFNISFIAVLFISRYTAAIRHRFWIRWILKQIDMIYRVKTSSNTGSPKINFRFRLDMIILFFLFKKKKKKKKNEHKLAVLMKNSTVQ